MFKKAFCLSCNCLRDTYIAAHRKPLRLTKHCRVCGFEIAEYSREGSYLQAFREAWAWNQS